MSVLSFLVGIGAGFALLANGPKVRRAMARAALEGVDVAAAAGKHLQKLSVQVAEDFEDAFAEARAEKAKAEEESTALSELHAEIRQLRQDAAELRSGAPPATIQ